MSETTDARIDRVLKGVKAGAAYGPEVHLRKDLELDSLDVMMLLFEIEKEFGIKIPEEDIAANGLLVLGRMKEYVDAKS